MIKELLNSAYAGYRNYPDLGQRYLPQPSADNADIGQNNWFYYLLKIIQKFWLVKSGGWNRHIRLVVAQIWSYDIIIEYWKRIYDIMT